MKLANCAAAASPHLWYQLYWVVYLDLVLLAGPHRSPTPKYIIHSPLDD